MKRCMICRVTISVPNVHLDERSLDRLAEGVVAGLDVGDLLSGLMYGQGTSIVERCARVAEARGADLVAAAIREAGPRIEIERRMENGDDQLIRSICEETCSEHHDFSSILARRYAEHRATKLHS